VAACTPAGGSEPAPTTATTRPVASTTITTPPPPSTTTTTASPPPTTVTTPPPTTTTLPPPACTVARIPAGEEDGFFTQACAAAGLTIRAGPAVAPAALVAAAERIVHLLEARPDLGAALQDAGITVAIIGADERITDLPDFARLYRLYPGIDWKRRGRSFPGTDLVPVVAGAEENLLCLPGDRYAGEDMFIRAFARALRRFAIAVANPETDRRIEQVYGQAVAAGRWRDTLAEVDSDRYWAEGTQSFFDANQEADPPDDSHNLVDTREELRVYDPSLFRLLVSVYGDTAWRPACP